jgi:hypothetical protein
MGLHFPPLWITNLPHLVSFLYKRQQKTQTTGENLMKGVQFVVNDPGKKKALLINLEVWEISGKIFMMSWSRSLGRMNPLCPGAS